jgi:hypothetical protein
MKGVLYWLNSRLNDPEINFCENKLKSDMSTMTFEITKPTIQKVVEMRRVNLMDMLGTHGVLVYQSSVDF